VRLALGRRVALSRLVVAIPSIGSEVEVGSGRLEDSTLAIILAKTAGVMVLPLDASDTAGLRWSSFSAAPREVLGELRLPQGTAASSSLSEMTDEALPRVRAWILDSGSRGGRSSLGTGVERTDVRGEQSEYTDPGE